jgi:hypothetical protein
MYRSTPRLDGDDQVCGPVRTPLRIRTGEQGEPISAKISVVVSAGELFGSFEG